MNPPTPTPSFEEALGEVEALARRLESGDLPLEEALSAFERGIGLVRTLNERLNEAEARIEVLTRGSDGELASRDLDPEEEDGV